MKSYKKLGLIIFGIFCLYQGKFYFSYTAFLLIFSSVNILSGLQGNLRTEELEVFRCPWPFFDKKDSYRNLQLQTHDYAL